MLLLAVTCRLPNNISVGSIVRLALFELAVNVRISPLGSVNAVLRNRLAMFVWLSLIVVGLLIGVATAFVGLIVIIPVIGYGAWHGYLETIDASEFPRHEVGITSVPRTENRVEPTL